ncbi:MAG: magnesium chelatase domain-containing protein, partial [Planctomycetota bacterium]
RGAEEAGCREGLDLDHDAARPVHRLADRDIFASVVGGLRVVEPAADLALLLSIAGANQRRAAQARTCAVGEVGLGGELRPVPQLELRLREAAKLGFTRAIVPEGAPGTVVPGLEIDAAASVAAAIERLS